MTIGKVIRRRTIMKKTVISLCAMYLLTACSSYTFKEMESIASKMTRFHPRIEDRFIPPKIAIDDRVIKQIKSKRTPASVNHYTPQFAKKFNNKKLYLSTLMQQYNELQAFVEEQAPVVNSCPHLHSAFLEMRERGVFNHHAKISWNPTYPTSSTDQLLKHHPELALPISYDSDLPRVIDMPRSEWKEYLQQGLSIYLHKMYEEIHTLCETGSTQSYYKFENLVHSERIHLDRASSHSMSVLLKNPLFVNDLLIHSLAKRSAKSTSRHRAIASGTHQSKNIFNAIHYRFKTGWFEAYKNQL